MIVAAEVCQRLSKRTPQKRNLKVQYDQKFRT